MTILGMEPNKRKAKDGSICDACAKTYMLVKVKREKNDAHGYEMHRLYFHDN